MGFIWVALEKSCGADVISGCLREKFPDKLLYNGAVTDIDSHITDWPDVVYTADTTDDPEFPLLINITLFLPCDEYRAGIELAMRLHAAAGCRTLCDGSLHGTDPQLPVWCLVFDNDGVWLASDAGTVLGEGKPQKGETRNPVRTIHRVEPYGY